MRVDRKPLTRVQGNGHEHELEPQYGLPEPLPRSERILWQGSPHWPAMARRVFHVRKLALYFGLLVAWKAFDDLQRGASALELATGLGWTVALSVLAIGAVAGLAWLTARTTVYTLTDKRVVMRIGIVLTMTYNLPLRQLARADLRLETPDGPAGDIALALAGDQRIPALQLWPHMRPWRLRQPEPMLRCLADAQAVAGLLGTAWSACTGQTLGGVTAGTPTGTPAGSATDGSSAAGPQGLAGVH